jgi:hypothetical protein
MVTVTECLEISKGEIALINIYPPTTSSSKTHCGNTLLGMVHCRETEQYHEPSNIYNVVPSCTVHARRSRRIVPHYDWHPHVGD